MSQVLDSLDLYLRKYSEGSDETERRTLQCDFCGDKVDFTECRRVDVCTASHIRIRGHRPDELYICNYCFGTAVRVEESEL